MNQHRNPDDHHQPSLHLALWEPDPHARERTAGVLGNMGFDVQGCPDVAGLFEHLDRCETDLVLVGEGAAQPQSLRNVLPRLSARYDGGILVQAPLADSGARLDALRAGAHLCLDRRYDTAELAALLRAQARRANATRRSPSARTPDDPFAGWAPEAASDRADGAARTGRLDQPDRTKPSESIPSSPYVAEANTLSGAGPGPAGGALRLTAVEAGRTAQKGIAAVCTVAQPAAPWRVLYQGWVLVTPTGSRVHLTGTERACFACLLADERREMSRAALSARMSAANLRSVNVSISRLRKKVYETGVRLPLHTVHGMGYVFVGDLSAQD